jgi:hypothetical protein
MKDVLALIEKGKQEFAELPFFKFLQDRSIHPRQRLAFAPCVAPMAMSFGDLNKYVLRKEPANSKIQEIINKHTYEDDHHWEWFLEDIEKLQCNPSLKFSDALRFIWSDETRNTRLYCQKIAQYCLQADPVLGLVALEAIEAAGNIFFPLVANVVDELPLINPQGYRFFGQFHFTVETNHAIGTEQVREFIESIELTERSRDQAIVLVEKIFEYSTDMVEEFMSFVSNHPYDQSFIEIGIAERDLTSV